MWFGILGPLVATGHDHRPATITARRDRAILAILLWRAGSTVDIDVLIDEVWCGNPPPRARNQIQKCVCALRRAVGADVLATDSHGYRIDAAAIRLDLWEFRGLVNQARAASEADQLAALQHLRTARSLWRGAAFEGLDVGLLARAAAQLDEERLLALEEWADLELAAGTARELIGELARIVEGHPFRERLQRSLMLALYAAGRRGDAVAAYRRARRLMVEELGQEPGPELAAIHRRILQDDPALRANGAARTRPAERKRVPRQLLAPPVTFTGRQVELASLTAPQDPAAVVVSMVDGMAGIGKTALAVRAAQLLAPHYPDGQLFLDLHGYTPDLPPLSPDEAIDRLLRALGCSDPLPAALDEKASLYRSSLAGRSVLVVLDNAASEEQIVPLIPGSAGSRLLVTTRRRLTGIDAAHHLSLTTLPLDDAVTMFTREAALAAAKVDRELIEEVVRLCGNLPLAIRVVGARLRAHPAWTVPHLIGLLADHTRRLTELAAGHRGVAAALDLSYRQLSTSQRRAFRLLGVCPTPEIDAPAAAALTGTTRAAAERLLDQLQEANLIDEHTPGRYSFHDLVRAYAYQLGRRHPRWRTAVHGLLEYYSGAATAADAVAYHARARWSAESVRQSTPAPQRALIPTYRDPLAASGWLDRNLACLLAAAHYGAAAGWPQHTLRLSTALRNRLRTNGRYREAEALHLRALGLARAGHDQVHMLDALLGLGDVCRLRGKHAKATSYLSEALVLARRFDDDRTRMEALIGLARVARLQGEHDRAIGYLDEAMAVAQSADSRSAELEAVIVLGHINRQRGNHTEAIQHFTRAMTLARTISDRTGELGTLTGLGHAYQQMGELATADKQLSRALALSRTAGNRTIELSALVGLGRVRLALGDTATARPFFERALEIATTTGSLNWQFEAAQGLGRLHRVCGAVPPAIDCHERALRTAIELQQPEDQARAHEGLAQAQMAAGQLAQARAHSDAALAILRKLGNDHVEYGEATLRASNPT